MNRHTIIKRSWYGVLLFLPLILFSVPLAGQSAGDINSSNRYSVDQVFAQPSLNADQLEAFQARAEILVYEFVDYYNLLRQPDLDAEMKEILLEEVKQIFYEEGVVITLPKSIDLATLSTRDFVSLPALEITALRQLEQQVNPQGEIWTFALTLKENSRKTTATVRTILSRQSKSFGTKQRLVWDVLLLSWETK